MPWPLRVCAAGMFKAEDEALRSAAINGDEAAARAALSKGADVNSKNVVRTSPAIPLPDAGWDPLAALRAGHGGVGQLCQRCRPCALFAAAR